jgi:hypothetical protein
MKNNIRHSSGARYRQEARCLIAEIQAAVGACLQHIESAPETSAGRSALRCMHYLFQVQGGVLEENYGTPGAVRVFDSLAAAASVLRDSLVRNSPDRLELAWMFVGTSAGRLEAVHARRQVAKKAGASVSTKRGNTRAAKLRRQLELTPHISVSELAAQFELDESWIRKIKRQTAARANS